MPIKYGEATIIHNKQEIDIYATFFSWFGYGYEKSTTKETKFVFLFEDGEIYDASNNLQDFKYDFTNSYINKLPLFFTKNNKKKSTYFYNNPLLKDNFEMLNVDLFIPYDKFIISKAESSSYNCIYYHHNSGKKPEIFGILRIKSSEDMPRFLFAYEADEFTKEEVIYLTHYTFNLFE